MKTSFAALERQRLARCRLLAELLYRRLPRPGGWSHCGVQLGTESTSLALLALRSSRSSPVPIEELAPLLACRRPNGLPEKPVEDFRAAQQAKLASDMLFASTPVRLAGQTKNRDRVEVILKDIYRENNRVYVRYAIQNRGRAAYSPGTPGVFTLRSPHCSSSLYALSQSQLVGDGIRITSQGQAPVKVLNAEVRGNAVAPGATAWGLVEFELPSRADGPSVVKFAFPSDGAGEVSAMLVL